MSRLQRSPSAIYRLVAIVILFTASLVVAHAEHKDFTADDYVPGEVVIKLFNSADLAAVATEYNLDAQPLGQWGTRPIFRLRIADGVPPPDKAAALQADPKLRIQYAEPNYAAETPESRQRISWSRGGSTGQYADQWAGSRIRLPEAHHVTRGAGVTVAVLDTGIDPDHPALAGRLVSGRDFVDDDSDPREEGVAEQDIAYGHGTHVAGLVALAAPEAKIMPLRVLPPDGVGNIWVLAEAMLYAANSGADVINLSLSTTRHTSFLNEVVDSVTCAGPADDDDDDERGDVYSDNPDEGNRGCMTATGRGVVVVAAAGNSGTTRREYPAGEPVGGVLAVAASTPSDTIATFSTRGSWVHVAAPGEGIISSIPGDSYGVWSGTSMAAPLVAGTAALLRSYDPDANAVQVAAYIVGSAAPIVGEVPRRLDAAAALGVSNPAIALASKGICQGTLEAIVVDSLRVPAGQTCILSGTHVQGSIKVERNAALTANAVRLKGSLQGEAASSIIVQGNSTVDGSIQIKHSRAVTVLETRVGGNIQLTSNDGLLVISHNIAGGNVQIEKNTGGMSINNNRISGNLQCKDNASPRQGSGNVVNGAREGQCATF